MAILNATIQQTPLGLNPLPENILRTYARAGDPPNPNSGGEDIHSHERTYNGMALTTTMSDIISFRASRSGNIVNVYLWVNNITGSGTSYYNLIVDGSGLWTGTDRLAVISGSNVASSKENLSVPTVRGKWITLDLESIAGGQIHNAPITIIVEID